MAEASAGARPAPTNLKEAYLRFHPSAAADYERHLMSRCMGLRARILLRLLGGIRPHAFNPDRALAQSMSAIRTRSDLESRIEEFADENRIDRSNRRRILGIRISGDRLRREMEPLFAGLVQEEAPAVAATSDTGTLRPASLRSGEPARRQGPQETTADAPANARRIRELELEIAQAEHHLAALRRELGHLRPDRD